MSFVAIGGAGAALAVTAVNVALFLKVDFLMVGIKHLIFQIGERFVGKHLETAAESTAPTTVYRYEPFFDVGIYKGVYIHHKFLDHQRIDQIVNLFFQFLGKEKRGLYLTFAETRGTTLGCR